MGTASGRAYYGDFRLWREVYEPAQLWTRGVLQEHKGVDRARMLVTGRSANAGMPVQVRCAVPPNPDARTLAGLVALQRAQLVALTDRAQRTDPLVWVAEDSTLHTVSAYAAPQVTSAGHPLANGDVVLLRKATGGVGEYLLGLVSNVAANTYDVASLEPAGVHVPVAGTQALLVEAYWRGMVLESVPPPALEDGGWWAREALYGFKGSGTYTYARTTANVGS